jgi:aminopeptidase
MGVKAGENILIVTDEPMRSLAQALFESCKALGTDPLIVEMSVRQTNGEEPPQLISEMMQRSDVVFCPTTRSLTHTDARRNASSAGARVATLPGVTEEIMVRCMNADYHAIAVRTFALCRLMEKTKVIRVTAPGGTDIVMPIEGREAHASSGQGCPKGLSSLTDPWRELGW